MPGSSQVSSPPHHTAPPAWRRSGELWTQSHSGAGVYTHWEAPGEATDRPPVVLVHGGGGQSLDWTLTLDGEPGWAPRLVDAGYPVYLVDRPGHGRSTYQRSIHGDRLDPASITGLQRIFAPVDPDPRYRRHTRWPWPRVPGTAKFDALAARSQLMLARLDRTHEADRDALLALLAQTGPAVVIAHSAGAPGAWVAAASAPDLVRAVVAIEPLGPPESDHGVRGRLTHGLSAVPLIDQSSAEANYVGLTGIPVAVVSADASGREANDRATVTYLTDRGVPADHLRLADHGLTGHGHGLMFEQGAGATLDVILDWLSRRLDLPSVHSATPAHPAHSEQGTA